MKCTRSAILGVITTVLETGAKQATKYLGKDLTVKATVRLQDRRQTQILLTIGKPNYSERKFIKICQKAKEPFPVKRTQYVL